MIVDEPEGAWLAQLVDHSSVSSVGCAGGQGFDPQTGPTLRILKLLRRMCCLCNYISILQMVRHSSLPRIRTINRRPHLLHLQCYMVNRGH